MIQILISVLIIIITSFTWYIYLHKKTRVSLKYLYIDNLVVIALGIILIYLTIAADIFNNFIEYCLSVVYVFGFSFILTMIRFWRKPNRKLEAGLNEIVSPADGNVIYIEQIEAGETPISIKNGLRARLDEITHTKIITNPGWLVGINMTPFDVHKNCAPVAGKILLNKHINGEYLSLKNPKALLRNERNSLVIENDQKELFGIVQTASKLVRRIDSYVEEGQDIKQGQWYGMIRFGSQVDIILPRDYKINVVIGQQIYAKTTIIAKK